MTVGGLTGDLTVLAPGGACGSSAGNQVRCTFGDLDPGQRRVVRFIATSSTGGGLSVMLDRPGEVG